MVSTTGAAGAIRIIGGKRWDAAPASLNYGHESFKHLSRHQQIADNRLCSCTLPYMCLHVYVCGCIYGCA